MGKAQQTLKIANFGGVREEIPQDILLQISQIHLPLHSYF